MFGSQWDAEVVTASELDDVLRTVADDTDMTVMWSRCVPKLRRVIPSPRSYTHVAVKELRLKATS